MTIPTLQQRLADRYTAFVSFAQPLPDEQFFAPLADGKWSVAETLQHLYLSARPVARLLAGPRDVLAQFGKPVQPSRSYDQLVADYRQAVTDGGIKAPANVSARAEDITDRVALTERFTQAHQGVADALNSWSEEELDSYQIPHPALGLLTVREIVYFTAYHIEHHLEPTKERLASKSV